jgi:excisionase family DNA binding protein
MTDKLLLNIRETARALGLSERHTWTLVRNGRIPSVWLGRRRMVPRKLLENYLHELAMIGRPMPSKPNDNDATQANGKQG